MNLSDTLEATPVRLLVVLLTRSAQSLRADPVCVRDS